MIWFVLGCICIVFAVICVVFAIADPDNRLGWAGGTAVLTIIGVLLVFLISGFREVPTKSVGVVTSFGKVGKVLRPGVHHTAPWTKVNILDETIQTSTFEGKNALDVRIGGQQTARLDATIQWRILDAGAPVLYANYNQANEKIMPEITNAVVIREFKSVVNDVLGDYNPIQDVAANASAGNSQFSTFGRIVLKQMRADLAGRITVTSVYLPLLRYDAATQARLNQIQAQYAETAIAAQQVATNKAQSAANAAIAHSVTGTGVLEQECLNIVQQAVKSGFKGLPAGFSCTGSAAGFAVTGK
jgi:regulator of protease activity HflC (stomatin/prohibitin superfamily)